MEGMTDRQFDAYHLAILRDLKRIRKCVQNDEKDKAIEELDTLIKDIDKQLSRP
jgi:ribosomal protein S20